MRYLPAIQYGDRQIRLPCPDSDLLWFLASGFDSAADENACDGLLTRNPCLLVFLLFAYCRERDRSVDNLRDLLEWINNGSCYPLLSEFDSLESAPNLDLNQLNRLQRWLLKPTRKRLKTFLSAVTDESTRLWKRMLKSTLPVALECELYSRECPQASVPDRHIRPWTVGSESKLPVQAVCRMASELHRWKAEFLHRLQQEKLEAMKQLAYGASHEINNPLANIASRAQTLLADESSAERRQRLAVIYAQAMRAHEMISDMMLFARPPRLESAPVDLALLVRQVARELRPDLEKAGIAVVIRQYPDVPVCEIDATQIAVAIKALMQNAIEAMTDPGEIRIQLWRSSPDHIGVSVTDDGPGVSREIANQIFDPFFSGREAGRGLGFGLSKVWRIVRLHGGDIELDEGWSQGARFVLTLPVCRQESHDVDCQRIDKVQAA